jgi:hypothetical protein
MIDNSLRLAPERSLLHPVYPFRVVAGPLSSANVSSFGLRPLTGFRRLISSALARRILILIGLSLRVFPCFALLLVCPSLLLAEQLPSVLPDAPLPVVQTLVANAEPESSSFGLDLQTASPNPGQTDGKPRAGTPVDANGNPVPLEHREPTRILGLMPNFRSVSEGAAPPPPGWKYNFTVANHQALDYSTFIFLGLTSLTAEGMDSHAALGKGIGGFYAYTWRGFLDKSDNTYLSAWLLSSALHEDTRYYALGSPHGILERALYVISRQAVARTYGGRDTPNIAGLGGKVLTQLRRTLHQVRLLGHARCWIQCHP